MYILHSSPQGCSIAPGLVWSLLSVILFFLPISVLCTFSPTHALCNIVSTHFFVFSFHTFHISLKNVSCFSTYQISIIAILYLSPVCYMFCNMQYMSVLLSLCPIIFSFHLFFFFYRNGMHTYLLLRVPARCTLSLQTCPKSTTCTASALPLSYASSKGLFRQRR